ncbi:MAG TPA: hypothetical protein VGL38_10930 [bacterium]|jgi:hypothetical protein
MKRVGIILVLAVVLLALYTLALAQFETQNSGYFQHLTSEQEAGGL